MIKLKQILIGNINKFTPHSIENINLSDGIYNGIMTGYYVHIQDISFKMNTGVRGSNIPCKIQVKNKIAYRI